MAPESSSSSSTPAQALEAPAKNSRRSLPDDLKYARLALFADGARPSKEDDRRFLRRVREREGCEWYTLKLHRNFHSRKKGERTKHDASNAHGHDHGDANAQASYAHASAQASYADAGTQASYALANASARAQASPSTRAVYNGGMLAAPTLNAVDAQAKALAEFLRWFRPGIYAQVLAARDPTWGEFGYWARTLDVPAEAVYRSWIWMHGGAVTSPQVDDFGVNKTSYYAPPPEYSVGIPAMAPPAGGCGPASPGYGDEFFVPYDTPTSSGSF